MNPSTVHRTRRAGDPLAWAVLVALAAIAALLLTRATAGTPAAVPGAFVPAAQSAAQSARAASLPTGTAQAAHSSAGGAATSSSHGSTAATSGKQISVMISNYAFSPASLTVAVGDTVTWTNMDSAPHTVTSSKGEKLDSPQLQKGQTWSHTFTQAGTVEYYCAVHPDMKASVTVTGDSMGHGGGSTAPAPQCEPSLVSSIGDPFWAHLEKGHLEASPAQQVSDLLDADQYVKTHTVLVESMTDPAVSETMTHAMDGPNAFWVHVEKGHLEASPAQQVSDLLDADQYVKTHTVLAENMLTPYMDMALGTC